MKYYIGDLCYVLTDEQWEKHMLALRASGVAPVIRYALDDVLVWSAQTAYGDGVYTLRDRHGDQVALLPVDSGSIGVIPMSLVREDMRDTQLQSVEFAEPPVCSRETNGEEEGFLRIGTYTIRTGAL